MIEHISEEVTKMKNCAVVVCLHGDEPYGLEVERELSNKMKTIIGNPIALEEKKRFLESDLNRIFPGKKEGDYEEKRAVEILEEIKEFEYIIDVHSSSSNVELFGIITKPDKKKIEFAKSLGLKRLVIMEKNISEGKSMIDNVECGISLEIGPHEKEGNAEKVIDSINKFLNSNESSNEIETYVVFDIIKADDFKEAKINNFIPVKKGEIIATGEKEKIAEFDFIPVLVNERSYDGVLCLAARKLKEDL